VDGIRLDSCRMTGFGVIGICSAANVKRLQLISYGIYCDSS
jgi:hypothetical protein